MTRKEAMALRSAIVEASSSLSDKTASAAPQMFDGMKFDGNLIKAGTRINWNGVVKKAAVDLWDTAENTPDLAPTIWVDLEYKEGIRIIPDVILVTAPFSKDELGWRGDSLYRSLVDNNVYTPEQYAPNWEFIRRIQNGGT